MNIEYLRGDVEPLVEGMIKVPGIVERYEMPSNIENKIRETPYRFGFGAFGTSVYMRTYSRLMDNGKKEQYSDTIVRVVKGVISIVKDWKMKHGLHWDTEYWDSIALRMGLSMMKMQFLPSGRNLWCSGTDFCYKKGASCLNNCGFVSTDVGLVKSLTWTMDSLMVGAGCGHDDDVSDEELKTLVIPGCNVCRNDIYGCCSCKKRVYEISDDREGWVKSLNLLLKSYYDGVIVRMDYSKIRRPNLPIKGFGGQSSGPEPLRILHERVRLAMECYINCNHNGVSPYEAIVEMTEKHVKIYDTPLTKFMDSNGDMIDFPDNGKIERSGIEWSLSELKKMPEELRVKKTYGKSRLVCDLFNMVGSCVISGNVRRSAEISLSSADNDEFKNLKNYSLNPERSCIGWISNNTVKLSKTEDFEQLGSIAERILSNGEPGILNNISVSRFGRITPRAKIGRESEPDIAKGINPCITGDSMISTSTGLVSVRDLIGRQFKAHFDHCNNIEDISSCERGFWSNGVKEVFTLLLKNGMSIKTTEEHKIGVYDVKSQTGFRLVKLKDIDIDNDMICCDPDHPSGIVSIEFSGEEEVFDCSIPGANHFYANGILVANCGEIPLESFEYCNLSEIFPTRCDNFEEMEEATKLATLYCSIISLLPTHWTYTNAVVARNHRIGVSISGVVDEIGRTSSAAFVKKLRKLYCIVRDTNTRFADENGVKSSIRVTTTKPSGTLSSIVGCSSGIHHPTYAYAIRRMRQSTNLRMTQLLKDAGYPWEYDKNSGEGTTIFSFPIKQDMAREATSVSMWEQASNLAMMQSEWCDNSCSCTIYFNPKTEGHDLENLLAHYAPLIKSASALPHTEEGVYEQAPYERISEADYHRLSADVREIDFSKLDDDVKTGKRKFVDEDSVVERGCSSGICEFNASRNDEEDRKEKKRRVDTEHVEEDAHMERGCDSAVCDYKAYMESTKKI